MDVFPLSCHSVCVSPNFAGTVSLKLRAFSLEFHLLYAKISFVLTGIVKLYVLLLPYPFTCVNSIGDGLFWGCSWMGGGGKKHP